MTFSEVISLAGAKLFFDQLFTAVMTMYGLLFVMNLVWLALFLKPFFRYYNVETGNNYVMSSSEMFSDNKGTLPMRVWLMLLIPFFHVYFIIYYANSLKKTFPNEKISMPLVVSLSLGGTILCVLACGVLGFILQAYLDFAEEPLAPYSLSFIPIVLLGLLLGGFFFYFLRVAKRNYSVSDEKED